VPLPNRESYPLYCSVRAVSGLGGCRGNSLHLDQLASRLGLATETGTLIASLYETEEVPMFALSAILIGVIGVFYVRRRSARKKQQTV
jgi:hypothetical protein